MRHLSVRVMTSGRRLESRRAFSGSLTNMKNKYLGTSYLADGTMVFGTSGLFFAVVVTAGEAYDARKDPDFRATQHAKILFCRSVTYPVIFGLTWIAWFPSTLVDEFFNLLQRNFGRNSNN